MFNDKLSLFNFKRSRNRSNVLPVDFGAMYFLYPSENSYGSGFRAAGIFDKVVDVVKRPFNKKSRDEELYAKDFF